MPTPHTAAPDTATGRTGRRLEPDARREEILDGALRLFGERPYAAVSTSELAREVGVARGLINHYFGTKRGLYLEVVRRLTTIPTTAIETLPVGPPAQRAGAAVDWFLDMVSRHRGLWLAVHSVAGDPEIDDVLAEADELAVDRVVAALTSPALTSPALTSPAPTPPAGGPGPDVVGSELLRARLRSYFGLVRAAAREWLVRGTMDRDRTHALLVAVLLVVLAEDPPATSQN